MGEKESKGNLQARGARGPKLNAWKGCVFPRGARGQAETPSLQVSVHDFPRRKQQCRLAGRGMGRGGVAHCDSEPHAIP